MTGTVARSIALRLTGAASAKGKILGNGELGSTSLNEEELPRTGTVVQRRWKYARWIGRLHSRVDRP